MTGGLTRRTKRIAPFLLVAVIVSLLVWFAGRHFFLTVDPPQAQLQGAAPELVDAIEQSRAEVRAKPRSAESWAHLGDVYLANNFYHEAFLCYEEAAALEPDENRWWYLQAVALEYSDLERSLPVYARAVSLAESEPYQLVRYGLACERAGRLDDAAQLWTQAVTAEPRNVDAHLGLGRIALGRSDLDAAAEHFHQAMTIDPRYREPHIALIQIANRRGDREAVDRHRALLSQCYDARPQLFDPLLIDVQRRWIQLNFVNLLSKADRHEAEGDLAAFADTCRQLIELDPDNPQPRVRLGIALIRMRRIEEADAVFQEAAERHPHDASVHFNYGVALSQMSRWQEAADSFRRAIAHKPDDNESLYALGICLEQMGDIEDAIAAYEEAVAARPDHFDAHHKLGELLPKLQKTAEAIEHLQIAQQLRPSHKGVAQTLSDLRQTTAAPAP